MGAHEQSIVYGKHLLIGFSYEDFCHSVLPLLPGEDVCRRGHDDWTPKTSLRFKAWMLSLLNYSWFFSKVSLDGGTAAAANNSQSIWASRKDVHKPASGLFGAWSMGSHPFSLFEEQHFLCMERISFFD